MTTVTIHYVAILREQRGLSEERITTSSATPEALYEELRARHGFSLPRERVRAAVNGDFAPEGARLSDGDLVVFIPPIAGG